MYAPGVTKQIALEFSPTSATVKFVTPIRREKYASFNCNLGNWRTFLSISYGCQV
jgi:hypothetical protein